MSLNPVTSGFSLHNTINMTVPDFPVLTELISHMVCVKLCQDLLVLFLMFMKYVLKLIVFAELSNTDHQ